jgi:hypothetical protein
VLDDRTCNLSPAGWGRRAVMAWWDWHADVICVETNYGGEMAKSTILAAAEGLMREGTIDHMPTVKILTASRSKRVRAEPVSAAYDDRWHHVGRFDELEEQQTDWVPDESDYSPDRIDALVWCARTQDHRRRLVRGVRHRVLRVMRARVHVPERAAVRTAAPPTRSRGRGLSRSRGVAQLVRPITLVISSALIARMVLVRTLPSAETCSASAAAVSSSGTSITVTMSYSPRVHSRSRTWPPAWRTMSRKLSALATVSR